MVAQPSESIRECFVSVIGAGAVFAVVAPFAVFPAVSDWGGILDEGAGFEVPAGSGTPPGRWKVL